MKSDIERLMARMTLAERIGQMTQVDVKSLHEGAVRELGIGSVLSGGGGNPTPNNPATWAEMVRRVQREALASRLGIPLLYGVDAVHGHSNVYGATIFPHNVALGATGDPHLVEATARITARELVATNVRWTFAPAVSVPQDIRWGRTFEAFGQDPEVVARLGSAFVRGLSTEEGHTGQQVLASPKHFVGDGGTAWGSTPRYAWMHAELWQSAQPDRWQLDQGNLVADEPTLRSVHLRPYEAAIDAGALSIMVSYSSWNGQKLHANRYLITDVLKQELGFQGFVVSDWLGVSQLDPRFENAVCLAINAGVDMVMVPFEYERFIRAMQTAAESGTIPISRIDDACRRILSVKAALGLFDEPFGDETLLAAVGSAAHRRVARQAVARSQVLLKNDHAALPLAADVPRVLVAGAGADDVGMQCGGWTIEWQGGHGPVTIGTTLLDAIADAVSPATSVTFRPDGRFRPDQIAEVGIVVVGEEPYAEGEGDRDDLSLSSEDAQLVSRVRNHCRHLVLVLYSGRPLILGDVLDLCDAVVASWLPGTEARGIVDVLFGSEPFSGRLPLEWPRTMAQVRSPDGTPPLFPLSYGLTTDRRQASQVLD